MGGEEKPWAPFQVRLLSVRRVPFRMRTMSRVPWPTMVLFVFSVTRWMGPPVRPEGGERSVSFAKTGSAKKERDGGVSGGVVQLKFERLFHYL